MENTLCTAANSFVALFATSPAPAALSAMAVQNRDPFNTSGVAAGLLGVRCLSESGNLSRNNYGKFAFFGTGAENTNFNVLLVGWQSVCLTPSGGKQWIPFPLASLLVTLGTLVGPAGGVPFDNATRLADTIALNSSIIAPNYDIWVPDATNCPAAIIRIDMTGFERVQAFIGAGTATVGNVIFSGM